jgi:hypothetical protein
MKSMLKCLLLFLPAWFIAGCVTANIEQNAKLKEDEGILIMKLHTNEDRLVVTLQEAAKMDSDDFGHSAVFSIRDMGDKKDREESLRVTNIKRGKSCVTKIGTHTWVGDIKPICFYIEGGAVNYVGDLVVIWSNQYARKRHVRYGIADNEEKTLKEAKENYGWLFEKYPYKKNIGKMEQHTVEVFE